MYIWDSLSSGDKDRLCFSYTLLILTLLGEGEEQSFINRFINGIYNVQVAVSWGDRSKDGSVHFWSLSEIESKLLAPMCETGVAEKAPKEETTELGNLVEPLRG